MALSRRAALAGLSVLALAPPAHAAVKLLPAGKLFPYLDLFLGIAAKDRTRFTLGYFLTRDGKPTGSDISLVLIGAGGARTPLPVGGDGRVQRLPTLADLKGKAQVETDNRGGGKMALSMQLLANVALSQAMDAREAAAAIGQCGAAIKAKAGIVGFAAPKIETAILVGGGSGVAVDAAGKTYPLGTTRGQPVFDPDKAPGAVTLKLARTPTKVLLGPRAK